MPSDFSMYALKTFNSSLQLFGPLVKIIGQRYVPRYGG
jgi:hypothetical protein